MRQESSACSRHEEKPRTEGTVSQGALRASYPSESKWTKHPFGPHEASRGKCQRTTGVLAVPHTGE